MESPSQATDFSERLYRALLVAYPREFRCQYSEQLVQAFGDLCREELEQRGTKGLLVLWMRTLGDLAVSVFSQRSGLPVFSLGGIRAGGLIIMLGGVLQFVAWTLFFSGIRLRLEPTSQLQFDIPVISPGPTTFPLLAIGLLVLGVALARRTAQGAVWVRLLAFTGVALAAVSAVASTARIVAQTLIEPPLPLAAGPPFSPGVNPSERPFGQPVEVLTDYSLISLLAVLGHSEYWTLALAGVVLGGALLLSGVAGRWWVLLPLMGLLAIPQVLGLLRGATLLAFVSVPGTLDGFSGVLLTPHAMVAVGWMMLGILLVSRRGERLEELARAS
ncbi:hypothetical protein BH24ACT22_BH24ACT22_06430 [soil metagenome]